MHDANGNLVPILGWVKARVTTPVGSFLIQVLIFKKGGNILHDLLIGMNLLGRTNINFQQGKVEFTPLSVGPKVSTGEVNIEIRDTTIQGGPNKKPSVSVDRKSTRLNSSHL